jgi:decaprenylphospho-beta-D-erythro-pentofuranosid-2-ulose 2-reductase
VIPGPVLVLGATSGIARSVMLALAAEGHLVVLAGRDTEELGRLAKDATVRTGTRAVVREFDAEATETHREFVASVVEEFGDLDGVVLAFGYLGEQSLAETDWAEARAIVDRNFTGAVSVLLAVAERFEARRFGWIVALSSVAGDRGRASNYIYGAAKGGLSVFLQGLRARLSKVGVHVLTVKPGPVDTAMTFGMAKMPLLADPEAVGKAIVRAMNARKDEIYVPGPWRLIMALIRHLPERVMKRAKF